MKYERGKKKIKARRRGRVEGKASGKRRETPGKKKKENFRKILQESNWKRKENDRVKELNSQRTE